MANSTQFINFTKQTLSIAMGVAFAGVLTACGGGGGGSSSYSDTTSTTVEPINSTTTTPSTTTTTDANSPEQAAFRLFNANRSQCGFGSLTMNQALNNTASNHANYLKLASESNGLAFASHNETAETYQNGTPLANTGVVSPYYSGFSLAERLSPTTLGSKAIATRYADNGYVENIAVSTLSTSNSGYSVNKVAATESMLRGLFAAPYHMRGLLYPGFKDVGISYQLAQWTGNGSYHHGSILELVSALSAGSSPTEPTQTLHFPCDNVVTAYELNDETPNPFGTNRNLTTNPVGQPIYVKANSAKSVVSASATLSSNGQSVGYIHTLTASNDPNKLLALYEVVFIPDTPLQPSTRYQATYQLKFSDGSTENKSFSFTTQPKTN